MDHFVGKKTGRINIYLYGCISPGTKVLSFDMSRSIISLRKIAHQIWCDHPFGQRKRQHNKQGERGGVDKS